MKKTTAFVLGGAAGAVAALMLAPRPGDETRAIVTDWASTLGDTNARNELIEVRKMQITHDAGVIANQAAELASTGVEKAKEVLSGAKDAAPAFGKKEEPDTDAELRARIEQARARIANQVAENAARAGEAVGGAIPNVTDAAKDVASRVQETAATAADAVKNAAKKDE